MSDVNVAESTVDAAHRRISELERELQVWQAMINPPRGDVNMTCELHGPVTTTYCPACDVKAGVNRKAMMNAARVRALREELRQLGIDPGPDPTEAEPAPNEARAVMTRDEKIEALQRGLQELIGS